MPLQFLKLNFSITKIASIVVINFRKFYLSTTPDDEPIYYLTLLKNFKIFTFGVTISQLFIDFVRQDKTEDDIKLG